MPVRFVFFGLISLSAMGNQSAERDWTVFLRRVGPLTIGTSVGEVRRIIGDPAVSLIQALPRRRGPGGRLRIVRWKVP